MTQEKLTLFHTHEAIETMFAPGGVVAEGRHSQCLPGVLVPKDPLIAIKGLAQEMSSPEVFAEAVEPFEISTLSGRIPAGDQHPLLAIGVKIKTPRNGCGWHRWVRQ